MGQKIYQKLIIASFVFAFISSISVQLYFKKNHFQEYDSIVTYKSLQEFPAFANTTNRNLYPDSNSTIRTIRDPFIKKIARANMPYSIQSFFSLPLSSTYSPMPGFIYGLVTYEKEDWHSFKSKSIYINILIFHIGIIFLYFFLFSITKNNFASIIASTIVLYSYSFHHYTYHLGSTVWIFTSTNIWLYLHSKYKEKAFKISLISSILFLFNYLILIYWIAFAISYAVKDNNYKQNIKNVIVKSIQFFFLFILVLIIFYPPNSGFKGGFKSFTELPKSIYYIVLNALSWLNKSNICNLFQFSLLILTITIGIKTLIQHKINKFFFSLCIILFVLFSCRILDFSPERQQLHLIFIFIIPLSFGLTRITINSKDFLKMMMLIILIFSGVYLRIKSNLLNKKQLTDFFYLKKNNESIIDKTDYLNQTNYIFNDSNKIKEEYNLLTPYSLISQLENFEQFKIAYKIKEVIILSKEKIETNQYFIAYNLNNASFNMPNNLYKTTFIIKEFNAVR